VGSNAFFVLAIVLITGVDMDSYQNNELFTPRSNVQPHRATLVLVMGVLGLVICGIFGIVAWVMGTSDLRKMREGSMDPSGMSTTNVGRILGMVSCAIWGLMIAYYLGMVTAFF